MAPAAARMPASVLSHPGNTICVCAMEAKISLGRSIRISPTRSMNQSTTSQKKSMTFPSRRQRYPLIPSPVNRWITPNSSENTRSFIGSLSGMNQSAGTVTAVPKNFSDTISTIFPKYPPNRIPHTRVESPQ